MRYNVNFSPVLFFLFILSFTITFTSNMISASPTGEGEEYLAFAEEMAAPIGGLKAILKKVVYPDFAQSANIQGKVYVLAFINENGDVDDVKLLRGIGGGCDEEALRAVRLSKFKPAKNKGQLVKVKYSLPITFKL